MALVIPETKGVDAYKDITPRMGVAYDVFGNGKTAVKANLGKYLEGMGISNNWANANPTLRMPQTTAVVWAGGGDTHLDGPQQRLRSRLRLEEPSGPDSATGGLLRRDLERGVRHRGADEQLRSGSPDRLGRPLLGLDAWALLFSSRFCREPR